jgi:hypothetical protein
MFIIIRWHYHTSTNVVYSLRFKTKLTFEHNLRYETKHTFGETSLKLRQTNWNVARINVNVVADTCVPPTRLQTRNVFPLSQMKHKTPLPSCELGKDAVSSDKSGCTLRKPMRFSFEPLSLWSLRRLHLTTHWSHKSVSSYTWSISRHLL